MRPIKKYLFAALSFFLTGRAMASIDDIVQAVASSEIRFTLAESYVPFIPVVWAKYRYYSAAEFLSVTGPSPGEFNQHEVDAGLVLPLHVEKRDIVVGGFDASYTRFDFDSPTVSPADVLTITPMIGWLRQVNADSQVGAFIAPMLSSALGDNGRWGAEAFAGALGSYRASERLLWIYGGVYEYSFGTHYLFPYLGLRWTPDVHWAISLVAPWPTVAYAPNPNCFLSLGVSPGGASWRINNGGEQTVASFGSWNLSAGAGYRLSGRFWLHGSAGMAGLRSLEITDSGDTRLKADVNRQPVFQLSVELRP